MKTTLTFALGIALLATPLAASAQRAVPPPRPACVPAHHRAALAQFDVDKNGRLDPSERHAMAEARRAADLAAYDKDGDGALSKAERAALHFDKRVAHFEAMDTNRDAEISRDEASASCTPVGRHFDEIDADASGTVSWSEFERAAKAHHRRHGPPPHLAQ